MNQRVKELIKQAGFTGKFDFPYGENMPVCVEKLTKLIVQDCINICEQQRLKILNNPNDPSWTEHLAECQITMEQTFLRS